MNFKGYIPFKGLMPHHTVNHSAKQYVVGDIHILIISIIAFSMQGIVKKIEKTKNF